MTDTAHHKAGANADGKLSVSSLIGDVRGHRVLEVRSPAGRHFIRPNPLGSTGGPEEFTADAYGPGNGFVSHYVTDASTAKWMIKRAEGERAISIGSPGDLWPDGFDAVPGSDR